MINRQVVLVSRPTGIAQAENFAIRKATVVSPAEGQILVRNEFLSVEPAMRGWIADQGNYSAPVAIGSVMRALAVGEVVESRHAEYRAGEIVTGWFGWQELATVDAGAVVRRVVETDLPHSLALGVLGLNGVTALIGLTAVGEPKAEETVLVCRRGRGRLRRRPDREDPRLRAVGIAGGPEKVRQCIEIFGYDAAIDYKAPGLGDALDKACPDGVTVYFDNTSGVISDTVYPRLAVGARVVICGTASISSWDPWPTGPRIERHLLVKRARAQGFVILDYMDRWEASVATLAGWVRKALRDAHRWLDELLVDPTQTIESLAIRESQERALDPDDAVPCVHLPRSGGSRDGGSASARVLHQAPDRPSDALV